MADEKQQETQKLTLAIQERRLDRLTFFLAQGAPEFIVRRELALVQAGAWDKDGGQYVLLS